MSNPDALTQIVMAAVENRRPISLTWMSRDWPDSPVFPMMKVGIDGQFWSVFFDDKPRGWALKSLCTSTRERTGLTKTLAAIRADNWSAA